MPDPDVIIIGLIVFLQMVTLALVTLGIRKSLWASRFALAAKGEASRASVNTTQQLEELGRLYRNTGLAWGDLPPTRGWAASPDFLNLLYNTIKDIQPSTVVELGSGVSSLVTASALKQNGSGILYSFDHEEHYRLQTQQELSRLGLNRFVVTRHAPLKQYEIQGCTRLWYDITDEVLPAQMDLLVVDGPPEPIVGKGGRAPVVALLFNKLSPQGLVLFDDAGRSGEQEILRDISKIYPDMSVLRHSSEKGAAIVKRLQ
mgnify:CR=1 FL=1